MALLWFRIRVSMAAFATRRLAFDQCHGVQIVGAGFLSSGWFDAHDRSISNRLRMAHGARRFMRHGAVVVQLAAQRFRQIGADRWAGKRPESRHNPRLALSARAAST
jgi:hypothetical protein